MRWTLAAAAAVLLLGIAGLAASRVPWNGPAWDDGSPDGHSRLAGHLAGDAQVAVLESSLALLPDSAGDGQALLLFATHRAPSTAEADAVLAFAERGGTVVVAADGGLARHWLAPLGGGMHGLRVVLPPGSAALDCLPAAFNLSGRRQEACLPSPTVLPVTQEGDVEVVGLLRVEVGLDLDGDGELGLADQAPQAYPVALAWALGNGRVIVVSDGDLWRNAAVARSPEALAVASLLVDGADLVYLDSTSGRRPGAGALVPGTRGGAADPASAAGLVLVLSLAALAGAMAVQRRHAAWRPHAKETATVPPALRAEALALLAGGSRRPLFPPDDPRG